MTQSIPRVAAPRLGLRAWFLGSLGLVLLGVAIAFVAMLAAGDERRPMPADVTSFPSPGSLCYQHRAATPGGSVAGFRCYPRAMLPAYGVAALGALLMVLGGVGALRALVERGARPGGVPYGLAAIATGLVAGYVSLQLFLSPLSLMPGGDHPPDAFNLVGGAGMLEALVFVGAGLLSLAAARAGAREAAE